MAVLRYEGKGTARGRNLRTVVNALVTLANELRTDHATTKTIVDEIKADLDLLRAQVLNQCANGGAGVGGAGLAEGTNATTVKTVNAVSYTIDGVLYTKAATDNIAFTATAQQAVSTYCLYLVSINSAGTVTMTKGTEVASDTAVLPALPASSAPLGYIKVATDGVTAFTGGTTDLGAAGITDTYVDLSVANTGTSASTAIAATGPATLSAAAADSLA